MTISPTFFRNFACKADKCRHTCCQKWVINIDAESAKKYRNTKGPLGEELRAWMSTDEEGNPCFRLNEKGYCHFLNEKGLCRLVLEKGPKFLCQICRDHPRFYVYSCDEHLAMENTLAGTGLACEETVEQLMAEDGEIVFERDDGSFPIYFNDLISTHFMNLPKKLQSFTADFKKDYVHRLLHRMEETNPIDEEPDLLLPTIVSRTQRINLKPLPESDIERYLVERYMLPVEDARDIAHRSAGSLLRAVENVHLGEENRLCFELFVNLMRTAYKRDIRSLKAWSEQVAGMGRERQKNLLEYCQRMVRENFICNFRQPDMVYLSLEELQFASRFAPYINERNIISVMELLEEAQVHIEQNVNPKMVFFDMALRMIVEMKQQ